METKAANAKIQLRIATCCTCKHNIEYEEGEQDAEHTDKFEYGCCGNIAVVFLSCGLYQCGKHDTQAKEIAEVREMDIKIPAQIGEIIKESQACDHADESQCAINCLINQLCGSVFYHKNSFLWIFTITRHR